MKLLALTLFLFLQSAMANELRLYVITPKFPMDWSSPQSLAVTTGANSITDDYAPIGHFAVEINCSEANRHGVKHVLTGMERLNKKESQRITIDKQLGLGSLVYKFKGALQSRESSKKEILQAAFDQRLNVIKIPTTAYRCQQMLQFLDDWIMAAAYKVYGGNKKTEEGEGAGCADFAMIFFQIATNQITPENWLVQIHIPHKLIGNGHENKVPFTEILKTSEWGTKKNGMPFEIADTNLVADWVTKNLKRKDGVYVYNSHMEHDKLGFNKELTGMTYFHNTKINPLWLWKQIKID